MDVFQILTKYYPHWSLKELIIVIFVLAFTIVFLLQRYKKNVITKKQGIAGLITVGWMLLVLGSTIFTRMPGDRKIQLELFWSWKEIIHPIGRLGTSTPQGLFVENILNMFLLLPVGTFLLIGLRKQLSWWQGLLVGILLSGIIELLQLILCRGLFEFDDILHNSIGCMIGCILIRRWQDNNR